MIILILTVVFTIFCSSPTNPSIGTQSLNGPNRHRFFDAGVRDAAGRGQVNRVRPVHRQLRVLHGRVQGDQPVGGDAKRAAVHVRHEKLFAQTRREGVPEGRGEGKEPGTFSSHYTVPGSCRIPSTIRLLFPPAVYRRFTRSGSLIPCTFSALS